jgi:hypothetical protein
MRDCDHPLSILRCRRALPIEALDGVLAERCRHGKRPFPREDMNATTGCDERRNPGMKCTGMKCKSMWPSAERSPRS